MARFSRPAKKPQRMRRNSRQAVVAVIATAACLSLSVFGVDQYLTVQRRTMAISAGDDDMYTGSILYMPDHGDLCRQLLFDNQNGQFTDNGYVDCARAFYRSEKDTPKLWSAARARVISTGFRDR